MKYTSIERVLAKFHRDLRGTEISEADLIEWIGEAIDFMSIYEMQEQKVAYTKVRNHVAKLPKCLISILQIARANVNSLEEEAELCNTPIEKEKEKEIECCVVDECGTRVQKIEKPPHWQWLFMSTDFKTWSTSRIYKERFTPVRLTNHHFFNSLVNKENDYERIYNSVRDEYTIVEGYESVIKTSFKTGLIAIAYTAAIRDKETGYPLIPDHISVITAITYYIKWKIAEHRVWNKEKGFVEIAKEAEAHWLKYVSQAKSSLKMPKSVDDYQNLLEETHNLIPNHKRYYGFFGNLGQFEKANV